MRGEGVKCGVGGEEKINERFGGDISEGKRVRDVFSGRK
jgi:hypothetical protein